MSSSFYSAVAQQAITCGPAGAITISGAPDEVPLAEAWANSYQASCGNVLNVTSTSDTDGVKGICNVPGSSASNVDIGLVANAIPGNVAYSFNFVQYVCQEGSTSHTFIQVEAALDGLAMVSSPTGIASNCVASLPGGGLTFSQIRWMFSSYTLTQLIADSTNFNPIAVPNSDGNDATHLWSELCLGAACRCPATEILIAGSSLNTSSNYYNFFVLQILPQNNSGETIATNRGFVSAPNDNFTSIVNYVTSNSQAIAFVSFAAYCNTKAKKLYAAAVENPLDNVYQLPVSNAYLTGKYPLSYPLYMEVRSDDATRLSRLRPFFVFAFSSQGDSLVMGTGLLPLPPNNKLRMLSRLGAPGGVAYSAYTSLYCQHAGSVSIGGSPVVYPLAQLWGFIYGDACSTNVLVVGGGNTYGAQLACGGTIAPLDTPFYLGMLTRPFQPSEAVLPYFGNGFDYTCLIGQNRSVREFPVAADGILLGFAQGGVAAKCIATLPGGGLTVDQARWIFSSFTIAKLKSLGWNASSVPNSDGNDMTYLWSELCSGSSCNCPAVAIKFGGSIASSDYFSFFSSTILNTTAGETVAMNRQFGYYSNILDTSNGIVQFLQSNPLAIAFLPYSLYVQNAATLAVAPIQNLAGAYVVPSETTVGDGTYSPLSRDLYMEVSTSVAVPSYSGLAYVSFGINSQVGDSLTRYVGMAPLSAVKKASLTSRFIPPPLQCFSGRGLVQVLGKGEIAMNELQVGDMVMNAQGEFDLVYSFGHYAPTMKATFLAIHAIGMSQPLEISPDHMLYVEGVITPASSVRVGHKLSLATGGHAEVRMVTTVVRYGAYAPFTLSGTIAVNSIASSVYVDLQSDSGVLVIRGTKTLVSIQFLAHMFQSPHRLVCKVNIKYCKAETYDERGMSSSVVLQLQMYDWVMQQNGVVMGVVFALTALVSLIIFGFELLLNNQRLLLAATCAIWALVRRRYMQAKR